MTDRLLDQFDIDADAVRQLTADTLANADDGELFVEKRRDEVLAFDYGRLRTGNYGSSQGFGLRAVAGVKVACPSCRATRSPCRSE